MSKYILVTGAAGFIGSKVAELLVKRGDRVVGIDNMNDYYDVSIKEHRLAELQKLENFEFRKLDLEHQDQVLSLIHI